MKTVSTSFHENPGRQAASSRQPVSAMLAPVRSIMSVAWAGLAALVVILLSVWAAGMDIHTYPGVTTWVAGFIFLGLAVDNNGRLAFYQMVTGVALLVLAQLQNSVSPTFIIVSGLVLAGWVAVVLFRRLSVQVR